MPRKVPNKFEVINDEIFISREGWPCIAKCTFREDYYNEIISHAWRMDKKRYPQNSTLGGGLHRYMMKKWYGEETLDVFSNNGYVVDHINNEHNDCCISNLEFLKKDYNTAKGQQLDKDILRLKKRIAIGVFKDFYTGYYQITIGCNDCISGKLLDKTFYVASIKLLYKGDYNKYPIVLNEAENILLSYELNGIIDYTKTNASGVKIYHTTELNLSEEEKKQPIVIKAGIPYALIGNGKNSIARVAPDKNWIIDTEFTGQQVSHLIPYQNILGNI